MIQSFKNNFIHRGIENLKLFCYHLFYWYLQVKGKIEKKKYLDSIGRIFAGQTVIDRWDSEGWKEAKGVTYFFTD